MDALRKKIVTTSLPYDLRRAVRELRAARQLKRTSAKPVGAKHLK
jgi:hypothetical protein